MINSNPMALPSMVLDRYSRKILWLEVTISNNEPENVARFYLDCVKGNGGCPILLRTDCGTENGMMAAMCCYFGQNGEDAFAGGKANKYGSSPANQRIESWWSYFRRGRAVIQNELDNVKQHWNTHRHGTVPGVPDVLFYLPQRSNAFECKQVVENPNCKRYLLHTQPSDDEGDLYQEYFDYVVDHEALQIPSSVEEAFNLFQQLKSLCVM
ncbi:hypothetical protein AWC38_SpisGene6683 [Stylophora pistillata]|uniref:Integrase catalytic domain-containing protein n=1 Tax=Stylophora pistillata TaxID=50429 RepID=A0A2B4SJE8_STYPI|nr:hypothetical protein AWC38_SpisGene6683 [Stylophora pistillata]